MNLHQWLSQNTASLKNKTIAVTGTTGGLGHELCRYLACLGASLILLDRNEVRSLAFRQELIEEFGVSVECIRVDLADMASVKQATDELLAQPVDVLIHNAGAYSIPRYQCSTGYDNVFQINFISPYYIIRKMLPNLQARGGRVVAVGSIAHRYSESDASDVDFSTRKQASLVYGNAKRYLMFSLYRLFEQERLVSLSITHPGISLTGITAHYPKMIFTLIKHPMKWIFMKPQKACLSILKGVFERTPTGEWIGPVLWDIWCFPMRKPLKSYSAKEAEFIGRIADKIYTDIQKNEEILKGESV